jgi:Holliday junction resolvase
LNTPYRRGIAAEKHVRALLRAKGYTRVIMSAASRTPIDMLASNGVTILAVQVKQGGHFAESDRLQLIEWAGCFKARPCLARKRRGQWVVEDLAV